METATPRARLENEVRLTARSLRPVILEIDGKDQKIHVKPVTMDTLEDLARNVSVLVASFFRMIAAASDMDTNLSSLPDGAQPPDGQPDIRSAGEGDEEAKATESNSPAERSFEQLFDPDTFMKIGLGAKTVISALVVAGTDRDWEFFKPLDFVLVIRVALEVIKYNLGPELKGFLAEIVTNFRMVANLPEAGSSSGSESE